MCRLLSARFILSIFFFLPQEVLSFFYTSLSLSLSPHTITSSSVHFIPHPPNNDRFTSTRNPHHDLRKLETRSILNESSLCHTKYHRPLSLLCRHQETLLTKKRTLDTEDRFFLFDFSNYGFFIFHLNLFGGGGAYVWVLTIYHLT